MMTGYYVKIRNTMHEKQKQAHDQENKETFPVTRV